MIQPKELILWYALCHRILLIPVQPKVPLLQMHVLSTDIIMNKHTLLNLQSIQIIVINQTDIRNLRRGLT